MSDARPMPTDTSHDPARVAAENRSAPALIGDLIGHVTELFRKETMLLRAELNEKMSQLTTAGGMLAASLVVALVGLIYVAAAVVLGLVNAGLAPGWATLIVGAVLAIIGLVMAMSGKKKLQASSLTPNRTVDSLSKDARMAKEKST